MENKIQVHIVDDEIAIVSTLDKLIGKSFPNCEIKTHTNSERAWNAMKEEKNPIILLTDLNMPGLTGVQLMQKVRGHALLKDSYIIAISSSVDPEENMRTVKAGADDFLNKPFSVDQLIVRIRAAMRLISLYYSDIDYKTRINELEALLEQNAREMIKQIALFQTLKMPELCKRLPFIVDAAVWIAKNLSETEKEIEDIKQAAEICFVGKLYLPEKFIEIPVMNKGLVLNKALNDIPHFAKNLLKPIQNTEEISKILFHIYENLDGSGIPENKKLWEIPLGSRILRVAIEFEELLKKNSDNQARTIDAMFVEAKRLYDHRVLAFYDQFLGSKQTSQALGVKGKEYTIESYELDEKMTVSRNIITSSGLILLTAGSGLDPEKIERIRTMSKPDPLIGKIYIYNK